MGTITSVTVPKWGLTMEEAKVIVWLAKEGAPVTKGVDLVDLETTKIANTVEAPATATLRRIVGQPGQTLPVGALLAILTEGEVSDAEVEAAIAGFGPAVAETFVAEKTEPDFVEVGGRRIRYLQLGDGDAPPLLLIHGLMGDLETWQLVRKPLAAFRPVYMLDLPGHGQSTKDVGAGDLGFFVETVRGFMAALGIGRAHLVGHSMGSAIALGLARAAPDKVASVTTLAGFGYGATPDAAYLDGMMTARRARDFKPFAEQLFADPHRVTRSLLEELARYTRLDGVEPALRRIRETFLTDPAALNAAAGVANVTAVIGELDRIMPPPVAVPADTVLHRLPTGHMPHLEAVGTVVEIIRARL